MLTTSQPDISELGHAARLRTCVARAHVISSRHDIVTSKRAETFHLVISGLAARYRMLSNGRRQITALILPGELCDLGHPVPRQGTGNVGAITACTVGEIPRSALFDAGALRPEWNAYAFQTLAREMDIASEWIVSLGQRSAYEATAHLFCELWERLSAIGLTDAMEFPFGLTQVDLADTLGLTPVHVNRTLRNLRQKGLLTIRGRRATILDHAALAQAADFDPSYLRSANPTRDRASRRIDTDPRQFDRPFAGLAQEPGFAEPSA